MAAWTSMIAELDVVYAYAGQATGYLEAGIFRGVVEARYEFMFPAMPTLRIVQSGIGKLEIFLLR
jgi:hypothetical protein